MDDTRHATVARYRLALLLLAVAVAATWGHRGAQGEPTPDEPEANASAPDDSEAATPEATEVPPGPPVINVPAGFTVEQVAGPPLVEHPMMAAFDDRGRLYVADAVGVNLNAEELQRDLPNRIQRLEDTDGDGRFDRATTFADKMTFPMGALWHRGAVYTASPPYIWRLEDTDDDGVADRREQIVGKFGFIGNAADIHGCFLGPEGRIYWCDGRHGHEFVDADGHTLSKGLAARIFSCRADGSDVQVYAGGGMDNPVEIAFTAEGEMLGTMTFYNPDEVRHDALVHYAYGGVYPRNHPCVAEFKRTGDFMPPLSLYGTVAPAGLMRYRGAAFGQEYRDNFFSVHFNTHKVIRHRLEREGATFRAVDEDFLTSPSIDFHATDVLEDADGSLLVIDTGGWFRNGCPTSQIAKPEILGAIYRVRRSDAKPVVDPRGKQLDWLLPSIDELVDRLDDKRPAVQDRAIEALATEGVSAVPKLARLVQTGKRAESRRLAVWTLARIDTSDARTAIRAALGDRDWTVRLAAARAVSASRDPAAIVRLKKLLLDPEAPVRREAATAMGRIGYGDSVEWLLQALHSATDRHLEHAIIYALIEIGEPAPTVNGLAATNPARVRRAALLALDAMGGSQLTSAHVALLLDSDDGELKRAAIQVLSKREAWSAEILELAAKWLASPELSPEDTDMLRGTVSALERDVKLQHMVGAVLADEAASKATRLTLLEAISRSELVPLPDAWRDALATCLASQDEEILGQAVMTTGSVERDRLRKELSMLVADESRPIEIRRAAACAVARPKEVVEAATFDVLLSALDKQSPPLERMAAAAVLGEVQLDDAQWNRLIELVPGFTSLEFTRLLRIYRDLEESRRSQLAEAIVRAGTIEEISSELRPQVREDAGVQSDQPEQSGGAGSQGADEAQARASVGRYLMLTAKFRKVVDEIAVGDKEHGAEIFRGQKAACSACHRIAGDGGNIGPDLSQIGAIRAPRDLVESIVVPSASLARGYESFVVSTGRGHTHLGVIQHETAKAIHLRSADRAEVRIARNDIDEMVPSAISVMPEGLDKLLTIEELRDLVAYLASLK